ncbi:hypothetical protein BGW38_010537, partial [Lunasporangiospora selenospora]
LANAGFYWKPAQGSPDNVICFLCSKSLDGWEGIDEPCAEHLSHSLRCGWAIIKTIPAHDDGSLPFRWDDEDELPREERMTKARIQTFGKWWPHENTKGWYGSIKKMANAGFFYAPMDGSEDNVQCPYCWLALDGWEPQDDPVHEHQRRCPTCPFFATRAAAPTKSSTAKVKRRMKIEVTQSVSAPTTEQLEDASGSSMLLKNVQVKEEEEETGGYSSLSKAPTRTVSLTRQRRQQLGIPNDDDISASSSRFTYLSGPSARGVSVVIKKRKLTLEEIEHSQETTENDIINSDPNGVADGDIDMENADSQAGYGAFEQLTESDAPSSFEMTSSSAIAGRRRRAAQTDSSQEDVATTQRISTKSSERPKRGRPRKVAKADASFSSESGSLDTLAIPKKRSMARMARRGSRAGQAGVMRSSMKKRPVKALIEIINLPAEGEQDAEPEPEPSIMPEKQNDLIGKGPRAGKDSEDRALPSLSADQTGLGHRDDSTNLASPAYRGTTPTSTGLASIPTTPVQASRRTFDDSFGIASSDHNESATLFDITNARVVVVDALTPGQRPASKADFEGWEDEDHGASGSLADPMHSFQGELADNRHQHQHQHRHRHRHQHRHLHLLRTPPQRQRVKDMMEASILTQDYAKSPSRLRPGPSSSLSSSVLVATDSGSLLSKESRSRSRSRSTSRSLSPDTKQNRLIDRLESLMHDNVSPQAVMAVAEDALREEVESLKRSQCRETKNAESAPNEVAEDEGMTTVETGDQSDDEDIVEFAHIDGSLIHPDLPQTPVKRVRSGTPSHHTQIFGPSTPGSLKDFTPVGSPSLRFQQHSYHDSSRTVPLPISKVISAIGAASRRANQDSPSPFVKTPVRKAGELLRQEDPKSDGDGIDDSEEAEGEESEDEGNSQDQGHRVSEEFAIGGGLMSRYNRQRDEKSYSQQNINVHLAAKDIGGNSDTFTRPDKMDDVATSSFSDDTVTAASTVAPSSRSGSLTSERTRRDQKALDSGGDRAMASSERLAMSLRQCRPSQPTSQKAPLQSTPPVVSPPVGLRGQSQSAVQQGPNHVNSSTGDGDEMESSMARTSEARTRWIEEAGLTEEDLQLTVEEFHHRCVTKQIEALELAAETLIQRFEEESQKVLSVLADDGSFSRQI